MNNAPESRQADDALIVPLRDRTCQLLAELLGCAAELSDTAWNPAPGVLDAGRAALSEAIAAAGELARAVDAAGGTSADAAADASEPSGDQSGGSD